MNGGLIMTDLLWFVLWAGVVGAWTLAPEIMRSWRLSRPHSFNEGEKK